MRASKLVSAAVFMVAVFSLSFGYAFAGPSQGVERFQAEETTYRLALTVGSTTYYHEFVAVVDGCGGEPEVTGAYMGTNLASLSNKWNETVTNWTQSSDSLSFTADYLPPGPTPYSYTFSGSSTDGGTTYLGTGTSSDGQVFEDMTVTKVSESLTDYKNHGQWVKASVAQNGRPDAHSCVGMPVVSKGKTG